MSLLRSLLAASVAVALVLPTLVQGAAVIQTSSYYSSDPTTCAGEPASTSNQEAGVCIVSSYDNTSSQYFCDTSYSYYVAYSDKACTTVQEVDRTPLGCRERQNVACVNATQGPAYPLGFPISGFLYSRQYLDPTAQDWASCPIVAGDIINTDTSERPGCANDLFDSESLLHVCAKLNGVVVGGHYTYNGSDCLASSFLRVRFDALCYDGTVTSCDNSPPLPSNAMPMAGRVNCAGDTPYSRLYPLDTCVYGDKWTCANGNLTRTSYDSGYDCSGSVYEVDTWFADGKTCQVAHGGPSTAMFTCNANSMITPYYDADGSSSSTASRSSSSSSSSGPSSNSSSSSSSTGTGGGSVVAASWSMLIIGVVAAAVGSRQ